MLAKDYVNKDEGSNMGLTRKIDINLVKIKITKKITKLVSKNTESEKIKRERENV